MRAGFGMAEITPPVGTELAGFGYYLERRMEGIRDPLHIRAAALEEGNVRVLVISCELLGLSQEVADALEQQHGIKADKRKIDIGDPIREAGIREISVWLYSGITTKMKLDVQPIKK